MSNIADLYKKQISLTEWFEQIGHVKTEMLRREDNTKRDRLGRLHELIGMSYEKPVRFTAQQVVEKPCDRSWNVHMSQ